MADTPAELVTTPETPAAPDFRAMESVAEFRKAREQATAPVVETPPPPPVVESPEQEAESAKPDTDVSEAARTLRKNRADSRKQQIQNEINELVKLRNQLRSDVQAPSVRPAAGPSPAPPVASSPAFPSFEPWAQAHPDQPYEGYIQAAINHGIETRLAAERAAVQQQTVFQTYAERAAAFKAQHPDYDDVISRASASPLMLDAIRESEHAPAIAYHLGQHPDEAAHIAGLPPAALFKALGAMEVRLAQPAPAPPAPKPVTSAPAPITPIGGSANGPVTRDPKDISSVSEWRKRRPEFAHHGARS